MYNKGVKSLCGHHIRISSKIVHSNYPRETPSADYLVLGKCVFVRIIPLSDPLGVVLTTQLLI